MDIGVLIITYAKTKRWHNVRKLASQFSMYNVYVSIDGPSHEYKGELDDLDVKDIQLQQNNLGSRTHCPKAISNVTTKHPYVLVLEDDLIFNELPNFEEVISQIGQNVIGCCFYGAALQNERYVQASAFSTWGWIVKSTVWQQYMIWRNTYQQRPISIPKGNTIQKIFLTKVFKSNRLKDIPHWDYPFMEYVISSQLKFLYSDTIVTNIGFNSDATNTKTEPQNYVKYKPKVRNNNNLSSGMNNQVVDQTDLILYTLNNIPYNIQTARIRVRNVLIKIITKKYW